MNQVEADEIFAKRLQEQFDGELQSAGQAVAKRNQPTGDALMHRLAGDQENPSPASNEPGVGHSANASDSGSVPANQKAASLKRTLTAHDISDSDSDDGDAAKPSKSLLVNRGASSTSPASSASGKPSMSTSQTYKIPKLKSVSSSSSSSSLPLSHPRPATQKEIKPKCQYGGKCYRKSLSHRREFRHSDDSEDEMPPSKKRKRDNDDSSGFPSTSSRRKNCLETVREASPLGFLLTKVTGIPEKFNNSLAVHISDILSPCMGDLIASAQFNYMFDIPWLVEQYPAQFRSRPLLIIHGEQRQSKAALHEAAHPYPNVKLCQAKLDIMYGTHHSKMMLLLYAQGMRVVIHTANMIDKDWHQKTQGVWVSPLFPTAPGPSSSADTDSAAAFQQDLVEYLRAYRSPSLQEWIGHIAKHDMSQARVRIIGSVPGRHTGGSINKWGHLKLRQVLKDCGPRESSVKDWPVIGQFSSVGSLGPDKDKWLCGEWFHSMAQCRGVGKRMQGESGNKTLKLIFPSKDNIRTSLEGYPAGASVPYSIKTAKKQVYFNSFLHQWTSNTRGRSRASPHIKTYCRLSPDSRHIAWFLATSANMSKAAWGALEKNGHQLMIRSYEIGVLFLPSDFVAESSTFSVTEQTSSVRGEDHLHFPLPWDVPLLPYSKDDRPWVWDIPYTDLPDSHGNCWVPPS